jgi:excisionase family DNA binding protein
VKTKREAAAFLGSSEKAIERYAAAGKLSKHVEKKQGGGMISYYQEEELEKLKAAMESKMKRIPPRQTDNRTTILARRGVAPNLMEFFTAISQQNHRPQVEIKDRDFLTIKESAVLKGLSVAHIEWAIKNKKLKAYRIPHVRGRRVRRLELDAYAKKI